MTPVISVTEMEVFVIDLSLHAFAEVYYLDEAF